MRSIVHEPVYLPIVSTLHRAVRCDPKLRTTEHGDLSYSLSAPQTPDGMIMVDSTDISSYRVGKILHISIGHTALISPETERSVIAVRKLDGRPLVVNSPLEAVLPPKLHADRFLLIEDDAQPDAWETYIEHTPEKIPPDDVSITFNALTRFVRAVVNFSYKSNVTYPGPDSSFPLAPTNELLS